jgi:hypothetical protein
MMNKMSKVMQIRRNVHKPIDGYREVWEITLDEAIDVVRKYGDVIRTDSFIISSTVTSNGPETCIFPSDGYGRIASYGKLPGSQRGEPDHDSAIDSFCQRIRNGVIYEQ